MSINKQCTFLETEGACRVWPADQALSFKFKGIYNTFTLKYIHLNTFSHFSVNNKKDFKIFFWLEPELHGDEISLQTLLA